MVSNSSQTRKGWGTEDAFVFERKRNSFASEPGGKEGRWIRRQVFGDGVSGRE